MTKPSFHYLAVSQFSGSNVNIICDGRPYLGAAIGTQEFCTKFLVDKVKVWSAEVLLLAKIAESQPHVVFSAFTHELSSRWHFVLCTVPDIAEVLQPLEDVIRCTLLPVLLGISPPNDTLRNVIALPPNWGGLGILNPTMLSAQEYSASLAITEPLSHHIGSGQCVDYFQVKSEQLSRKSEIHLSKQSMYSNTSASLCVELDHASQVSLDLATTRGASAWFSALPLTEYGFTLHKAAFHDAIALRYGWPLHRTPSHCAYGTIFSVHHALSCPKDGLPSLGTMKSGTLQLVS